MSKQFAAGLTAWSHSQVFLKFLARVSPHLFIILEIDNF
jgi:hypothetical protein